MHFDPSCVARAQRDASAALCCLPPAVTVAYAKAPPPLSPFCPHDVIGKLCAQNLVVAATRLTFSC